MLTLVLVLRSTLLTLTSFRILLPFSFSHAFSGGVVFDAGALGDVASSTTGTLGDALLSSSCLA